MAGPLAKVGTTIDSINLDISRKLNWGKGLILEFITVDRSQMSGWAVHAVRTKGFDRIVQEEKTTGEGSDSIFEVADLTGNLRDILRLKDLHIRVDESIYKVSKIPPLPPNVAQIFTLMCKVRVLKGNFDTTK